MNPTLRRAVVALAGALLASAGLGAVSAAATERAPQAGACTSSSGITVIVDFGPTNGGVKTRCAPGPVKTGFDALVKAGFDITNVRSQPGFLCQIDAVPESDCSHVPSASRYWSYWHADRGRPWIYSTSGASRTPPPGSVEGWAFGASTPPAVAPPAPIVATTTTSRPPSSSTVPPATSTPPIPGATTTLDPGAATSPTTTEAGAAPTDPGETTTTTGTAAAEEVLTTDDDLSAALTAADRPDEGSGSAGGLIAAGLLVAGVGAVGVRTARRRAREAEGAE